MKNLKWVRLAFLACLAGAPAGLPFRAGPGSPTLELLARGRIEMVAVDLEWTSLRAVQVDPLRTARDGTRHYSHVFLEQDRLGLESHTIHQLLEALPGAEPGARVRTPSRPTLALVLDPGRDEARFLPLGSPGAPGAVLGLSSSELAWPEGLDYRRSQVPPRLSCFFLTRSDRDGWFPHDAAPTGAGFAVVDHEGTARLAWGGDPHLGTLLPRPAHLVVARDGQGRIWCWLEEG